MNPTLSALANEVLHRLGSTPLPPPERPQFLASAEGLCLLRTDAGLSTCRSEELPADLDITHLLDHTLLKAPASTGEIERLCLEALHHTFASVCVNPTWVERCTRLLENSRVAVCTVVGFPLGASTTGSKVREAGEALDLGATEIDFVVSLGAVKSADWGAISREFRAMRRVADSSCLKVILETCLLEDEEKRTLCRMAAGEGLDFVKTSTGFSTGGATEADVTLMRAAVGAACGVKASGGIRTRDTALAMLRCGATRLGVSASLALIPTP
nr:deoxyribose-phosphate aldolase [uncultured Holophaga sp.]